jgi:hypothetical protein
VGVKLTSTRDLVGLGVGTPANWSMLCTTERRYHSYGAMIAIAEGADAIKEVAMPLVPNLQELLISKRNSVRKISVSS